ncbi:hypothetical protein ACLUXY_08070 [Limosilactobacillus reuteri subsp. suis]|uniref:hypothetical protein n=1 Tax=Limosilactobacillus reuteri TaxID=1598 RepID=UPI003994C747
MATNVKRNMIQVRLSDRDFNSFEVLRNKMGAKNNAAALRQLINEKKRIGTPSQSAVNDLQQTYDDLAAKLDGLMWNSGNITNNMNQIAHNTNLAKESDPANVETWNWVVNALKTEYQPVQQLSELVQEVKNFLTESRNLNASDTK